MAVREYLGFGSVACTFQIVDRAEIPTITRPLLTLFARTTYNEMTD